MAFNFGRNPSRALAQAATTSSSVSGPAPPSPVGGGTGATAGAAGGGPGTGSAGGWVAEGRDGPADAPLFLSAPSAARGPGRLPGSGVGGFCLAGAGWRGAGVGC